MSLTRVLVLASYLYQSVVAVALVFLVSHLLDGAAYTAFSLAAAFSQLVCVLSFEWLQIAGTRFLSGATEEDRLRLRSGIYAGYLLGGAALIMLSISGAALALVPVELVFIAAACALAQGLADLFLTITRVEGRLSLSAGLLVLRGSAVLIAAGIAAFAFRSVVPVLAGMLIGQAVGAIAALIADRHLRDASPARATRRDIAAFARYGLTAAFASVIFLGTNVMVRVLIVGGLGAGSAAAAGFSMAFDLLQRPFSIMMAALNMITYPEVVARYERGTEGEWRAATARLFEFFLCPTLLLLAGLFTFMPDVAWMFVPAPLLASFLDFAPAVCLFAFANSQLQFTGAVVLHLLKDTRRLVVIALGQAAGIGLLVLGVLASGANAVWALGGAAGLTLLWLIATAGPTYRFGAFPRRRPVVAALLAASAIAALAAVPGATVSGFVLKSCLAALASAAFLFAGGFATGPAGAQA